MKKLYISILILGSSASVFGQYAPKMTGMSSVINAPAKGEPAGEKALGSVIWSDNFSDATTWTIDNSTQTDPAQWGWDIGTTEQSWFFTSGINSTSGGAYAELKNGNYNTGNQATNVVYNLTTANPIDVQTLGGTDQVTLSFQQRGALFNDDQQVQISTDGINFTTVFTIVRYLLETTTLHNMLTRKMLLLTWLLTLPETLVRFGSVLHGLPDFLHNPV
jgi:hypothetical protein